jgi:hypothetical protein
MERKYLEYFEGAFDSTVAEKIKPENKPYVAYSKENGVAYTIIPKEGGTMYTIYRVVSKDISNCTYNMVDLGLSVKWADRNVGATSPEHYGSYFQWGDTDAYTYDGAGEITAAKLAEILNPALSPELGEEITADNVGMILEMMGMTDTDITPMGIGGVLGKFFNWDSYFDTTDGGSTFKKYNNNGGLTVLESVDDAAAVHTNSQLRMPTPAEIQELISGTTQTFIDVDGNEYIKGTDDINIEQGKVKGVRFTGSNGNSVFIPAAGVCYRSLLYVIGMYGVLWSSSLNGSDDDNARYLYFSYDGNVYDGSYFRYCGLPIRGVQAQS